MNNYKIKCVKCSKDINYMTYDNLDYTFKDKIFKNELFKIKCECGFQTNIFYPVIYKDDNLKYIIEFKKDINNLTLMNHIYKYRVVNDYYSFVEKILIFDLNLDDRIFEIFKEILLTNINNKNIKYLFLIKNNQKYEFISLNDENRIIGICPFDISFYEEISKLFTKYLNEDNMYLINKDWALKFLMEVKL